MHPALLELLSQAERLCWLECRFEMAARKAGQLPPYLGSTLRGAFGQAFKEAVCLISHGLCAACLLRSPCPYPYVFEAFRSEPSPWMRRQDKIPQPFLILPPLTGQTRFGLSARLEIGFRLFGASLNLLPYFVLAWERLGQRGLGSQRLPFELCQVTGPQSQLLYVPGGSLERDKLQPQSASLSQIPPFSGACRLELETPLRLSEHGQLLSDELPFDRLVASLLRRLSAILYFHQGLHLQGDFKAVVEAAKQVEPARTDLHWQDFQRRRSRQHLNLGGLNGWLEFGAEAGPFWPLLWLGQFLQAGQGTSFGLGRYRLLAL